MFFEWYVHLFWNYVHSKKLISPSYVMVTHSRTDRGRGRFKSDELLLIMGQILHYLLRVQNEWEIVSKKKKKKLFLVLKNEFMKEIIKWINRFSIMCYIVND